MIFPASALEHRQIALLLAIRAHRHRAGLHFVIVAAIAIHRFTGVGRQCPNYAMSYHALYLANHSNTNNFPAMHNLKQSLMVFFAIVVIGSILSAIIPPMQSPDEADHLKRAYLLSRGLSVHTPPGQSTGGEIDDGLNTFMATYLNAVANQPHKTLSPETVHNASEIRWSRTETFQVIPNAAPYFPLAYIPQAVGLRIGKTLNLNIGASYRLSRAVTLITIAALLALAFQIFPPNALVICLLALPMTMFQAASATQDGLSIAWLILAGSLFRRGLEREKEFPVWMGAALIISTFFVVSSRPQFFPMVILPASVFWIRKNRRALIVTGIASLGALAWILQALGVVNMAHVRTMTTGQVVSMYAHHPIQLAAVFVRTLTDMNHLDFYWKSFVGMLGWLDTPMPHTIYALSAAALIVTAAISFSAGVNRLARWLPILCAVLAIGLAFVAMLITWTEQPARYIEGVQGRYFIGPAFLIAYAIGSRAQDDRRIVAGTIACGIFTAASVFMTASTLLWRYYLGM
ncbi:DUF2142 domain-containing protein [Paraburkholderia sp. Cy-641]|uniref:DUF2142 domain-containing protein n=1 Tax=Paraburkholderia sp. Cy-641 TaxID=2608337 RepID=UPI0014225380|nr:DUF2142 domain-containing protein [Paraburkholderia sp. Cy-641]